MCGVFGVYNNKEAANLAYMGLYAQQHRGQESAGIVSSDGEVLYRHAGHGLVSEVFKDKDSFAGLRGNNAIGHVRYSTAGDNGINNIGPLWNYDSGMHKIIGEYYNKRQKIAVSHNGNLTNVPATSYTDTKFIINRLERINNLKDKESIERVFKSFEGSYALLALMGEKMIAARDPNGIRPLCMGILGDSYVFASETCALDLVGATYVRDVDPGEIIVLDAGTMTSFSIRDKVNKKHCIFEYVYFARPDSKVFGQNVSETRKKMGKILAEESPCPDVDIVMSVPDSSNIQALRFADETSKKFEFGLIRNHYIGRTFIYPNQRLRDTSVKLKFNVDTSVVKGQRVAVIDDSIVRGTTLRKLTKLLKEAGAKEVHLRSSSPPVKYPCFYGMDFPTKDELVANKKSIQETKRELGAESLEYLSLKGLLKAAGGNKSDYCTACFNGCYIEEKGDK